MNSKEWALHIREFRVLLPMTEDERGLITDLALAEAERDSWKAMASREAQAAVEYVGAKEAAEDERDEAKRAALEFQAQAKRAGDALDWQAEQDRDALEGMRTECDRLRATVAELTTALQALYDEQNGPPLICGKEPWYAAMKLAEAALKGEG